MAITIRDARQALIAATTTEQELLQRIQTADFHSREMLRASLAHARQITRIEQDRYNRVRAAKRAGVTVRGEDLASGIYTGRLAADSKRRRGR